jgi:hypothetical protein
MSTEACPHCHEKVDPTDDGCDTERCRMRRAFIRQAAIKAFADEDFDSFSTCWSDAVDLWNAKPEGC